MKFLIAAPLLATSLAFAGETTSIPNGDLEAGENGKPAAWTIRSKGAVVSFRRDQDLSSRILSFDGQSDKSGVFLSQRLDGALVREGPSQFSAMVRTKDIRNGAHLFVSVDGPNGRIFKDDMRGSPISGDNAWTRYSISIPQLANARSVSVGAMLFGKGNLSVDDFRIGLDSLADSRDGVEADYTHLGEEFIEIIESRYVFAPRVDTGAIRSYLDANLPEANNRQQAHAMLRTALEMLNEPHASFMESHPGNLSTRDFNSEPGYSLSFTDGIALLSPSSILNAMDEENFGRVVNDLEEKISALEKQPVKGWVIDLRGFSGGSSWRLFDVLQPFQGQGRLGGFQDRDGHKSWGALRADPPVLWLRVRVTSHAQTRDLPTRQ